jgi:nucleoside-diphosphate-sugar epimerase
MNQVLAMIERVTGRKLNVNRDDAQKGDMRHTYADTTLARQDLGFTPRVGLEEGLAAEFQWLSGVL